ncbi:hypothetical protein K443DRAFT_228649 [Laccaria amethystina LaAM-08-1]|uniref:Uncharacterized protein n=1 Tax=Laccaria amethystina LaAM-08-1 TaxID=1095629 RepID=A0A0C9WY90_9AGAR|nr:hypothetical protein K443DRAFT_228649 [Laccaria amethystina LaAM-08-1]
MGMRYGISTPLHMFYNTNLHSSKYVKTALSFLIGTREIYSKTHYFNVGVINPCSIDLYNHSANLRVHWPASRW